MYTLDHLSGGMIKTIAVMIFCLRRGNDSHDHLQIHLMRISEYYSYYVDLSILLSCQNLYPFQT
ncbi:hypothetical protein VCR14J2_410489 [Vibrio coralliirubri]|nr:hypothetical protein VCR6J2_230327 [Vibrio coralliirubri]CDT75836.1 hypothetical protein VCR26J2_370207 [Vibrio coralliirubri]CDU01293.1 hypothetical protein VCR12J2_620498 [Vibrio coralliirubri]CDU04810.1 hypothetical protein VCR3J2_80377 [Vibrio coralliirubri]CDU07177.1 hypothetical protein VCR14J2_410489 [Vibrio coralliirubri]